MQRVSVSELEKAPRTQCNRPMTRMILEGLGALRFPWEWEEKRFWPVDGTVSGALRQGLNCSRPELWTVTVQ